MENYAVIAAAVIMPVLASAYAMIRKPKWYKEVQKPNWLQVNIIALILGIIMGLIPAIYSITVQTAADTALMYKMYVAECFSVIGWCTGSTTITDIKAKKIDRHMMRPLYTIQIIVSVLYCLYMPNGSWVFALTTFLLAFVSICAGYVKIGGSKKPLPGETLEKMKKRLENDKPHGILGASDARLLAVITASSFPLLTYAIIWPIIGMLLLAVGTAVYYYAYTGSSVTYDSNGQPIVTVNESTGAERIISNKANSFGKQRTPQAHSICIPFMVSFLIWILAIIF